MNYQRDIFYSTEKLSFEQRRQVLLDAKEKCYKWHVDILDCKVSWARQYIDMSFEDIMQKFNNSAHFVIINRKGYKEEEFNLEIGFSTMIDPSYYLWIHLKESEIDYFIEKYKLLKKLN